MTMKQEKELRTVEQICFATDEILERAHQLDELSFGLEGEKAAELNRLTGIIQALQWVRYMSRELE
jgi:hypothetical protein